MSIVTYHSTLPQRAARLKAAVPLIVEKTGMDALAIAESLSRVDTGNMATNWQFEMVGPTRGILGNPVDYTLYNEYGTVHMSAQPMIRPAIAQVEPEFLAALSAAMYGSGLSAGTSGFIGSVSNVGPTSQL